MGTIKSAKATMGFITGTDRLDCCRHCQHVDLRYEDRMPPYDYRYLYCKAGGFKTTAMAVCDQQLPMKGASHG